MNKDSLLPLLVLALGLTLTLPASATLIGRDLDISTAGFEAYYDDVLDITWQANANLLASNSFGLAYDTQLGDHPSTIFVETDNQLFIKIVGDGDARRIGGPRFHRFCNRKILPRLLELRARVGMLVKRRKVQFFLVSVLRRGE